MTDSLDAAPKQQPEYISASHGRRLGMWRVAKSGPNTATLGALDTLIGRSRDAVRNDPWAGAAIDKMVANAVGTGIVAKQLFGDDALKGQVNGLWDQWSTVADADGVLSFEALQALAWQEWEEAGEVFIRLRQRRLSDGLPVPLQLQLIEAEQCPADYYALASNGNQIRAGIEFDAIGRRVAYWMYPAHPGDVANLTVDNATLRRVPAEQVLHLYQPQRAGQMRGTPRLASVLHRLFNIVNFDDAVMERQKIANLFTLFYVVDGGPNDGAPYTGPIDDVQTGTASDGAPLAGLEPGLAQELPPGVKPEFSNPPDAGANYADFLRMHLLTIAARAGVPYEVLTGDLQNVSDRALKLILNEFRRLIEQRQWLYFIPQFCQRIREAWFDAAVLAGAVQIDGYAERRAEIVRTRWQPQGWPWSHPVQDVSAEVKAIRGGLEARSQVVLRKGEDPEEVDRQIAEDNARADAYGFVFDSDPRKTSNAGLTQARPPGTELPDPNLE